MNLAPFCEEFFSRRVSCTFDDANGSFYVIVKAKTTLSNEQLTISSVNDMEIKEIGNAH